MKKRYRLTYAERFDLTVEIDHAVMTESALLEINRFWSNADDRILEHGSALNAVLKMLCSEFMAASFHWLDPVDRFNRSQVEGWPSLDGKYGITLIRYDRFEFDADQVELEVTA